MGRLSDAKTLGGIGSILQLIPFVSIVGYILTLIAVKYISDEVHDSTIFSDMLYAVIAGIVGIAVGAFAFFFGVLTSVATFGLGAIAGIIGFLAIAWIALIVSAYFVRRAFGSIATKINVGTFRTAGTLYFIGALLVIALGLGFVILFVAFIIQIVAFFSIHETAVQPTGMQPSPMPSSSAPSQTMGPAQAGTKYCVSCGTPMPESTVYCPKCGTKQP